MPMTAEDGARYILERSIKNGFTIKDSDVDTAIQQLLTQSVGDSDYIVSLFFTMVWIADNATIIKTHDAWKAIANHHNVDFSNFKFLE